MSVARIRGIRNLASQFAKFGVVGVSAFIIDYVVMIFLAECAGIDYLLATTAGFIAAMIFNYFASMRFVFLRKSSLSRKREFALFSVLSLFGLAINDLLMYAIVGIAEINYRIAKIVSAAIVGLYNFATRKKFLEDKLAIDGN